MASIVLSLALMATSQVDPAMDETTVFALLRRYHSSFRDVSFIHEGKLERTDAGTGKADPVRQFQTFYAYRSDGATLLDRFSQQAGKPKVRTITSLLHDRAELLDATPDRDPPILAREPEAGPGGPGTLGGPYSPERIFLAWYMPTLAEPAEHDVKALGWEDVGGHRCLKVSMLRQPRKYLQGWHGDLPFIRLWIDPQRDGYPIRYEHYEGEHLHLRGEITRMERLQIPDGRAIWFPIQGKVWGFFALERGRMVPRKEPTDVETHGVLINSVKFNQGLKDSFFSVKKHALVASDEGLKKLLREMQNEAASKAKKVVHVDPESHRKRLDEALAEADRQAQQLEASSAARAGFGWSGVLYSGLGAAGVLMLGIAGYRHWRAR
jgi:hypothetical protein